MFSAIALKDVQKGVGRKEITKLFDIKPQTVADIVDQVADAGWFIFASRGSTIEGVLAQPKTKTILPKRALKLAYKTTAYKNKSVREWSAKDFTDFFLDKWAEVHDEELTVAPTTLQRGLIKDGVNKLYGLAGVRTHPRVFYRQYLLWAIPRFDKAKTKVLKDVRFFRWFLDNREDQ